MTAFSQLPLLATLDGNEIVPISVPTGNRQAPFSSSATTTSALVNNWVNPSRATVTRRQLFSALASQGEMQALYQAVNADPNTQIWVDWNAQMFCTVNGVMYAFIQQTLGYSDNQMSALWTLALTYPA